MGTQIGLRLHKLSKIFWVLSTVLATAPGFAVEVLVVSWLWRHPIRCASHLDCLDLEAWELIVLSRHHLSLSAISAIWPSTQHHFGFQHRRTSHGPPEEIDSYPTDHCAALDPLVSTPPNASLASGFECPPNLNHANITLSSRQNLHAQHAATSHIISLSVERRP